MTGTPGALAAMPMPPPARIEAALRLATERFAAELALPGGGAPDWSEFQWAMARAAAVMHGVTPLLASLSGWREPDQWLQFAAQQRDHTVLRQQRLAGALALIDQQMRRAALPVMALKGSALYALGLYRDGERPMADIDLLVTPHESTQVRALLEALGFREVASSWKHWELEARAPSCEQSVDPPYGERASAAIKIDLHQHIAECLPVNQMDITEWVWPSKAQSGLNPYPSMAALMLHLLLHAAGNMVGRSLRLIQVHDLALVAARMCPMDWDALLKRRISGQPPWWALPPLELVARYYPGRVPPAVLAALRSLCPRMLRERARRQTVSDVSYCTLKAQAFPALPWAITFSDKFDYVRMRGRLYHKMEALRANWNREAQAASNPWRQQSRSRRIVHWLLARSLRHSPTYLVRAVLADQAARADKAARSADAAPARLDTSTTA